METDCLRVSDSKPSEPVTLTVIVSSLSLPSDSAFSMPRHTTLLEHCSSKDISSGGVLIMVIESAV